MALGYKHAKAKLKLFSKDVQLHFMEWSHDHACLAACE